MNAVEIEQAITDLAEQPFDPAEFPYAFPEAFGNKATTLKRLRAGASNKSDLGGVLQTSNIHILTCDAGRVTQTLAALKASPATVKAKAKFILATDGADFEAEDRNRNEGLYFVRYVAPTAEKKEPGFFGKIFGSSDAAPPLKYRIRVQAEGNTSTVSVLNETGAPESSANAERILKVLADDLR